ncbi:hypothetical protein [Streptomyces sp. NPDC058603]|uniref:hypothetical protein n=1 Tax=Streptomyces sp. NPDC058603 TaxID=3346551 RepID=UPI003660BBD9
MDQGTATVWAAVAAAVGVLVTGWFTYRASRRQPIDQGDVELGQTLRGERQAAYEGFINGVTELDEALAVFDPRHHLFLLKDRPALPRPSQVNKSLEHLEAASAVLGALKRRVEMAGPHSVVGAADDLWLHVIHYQEKLIPCRVAGRRWPLKERKKLAKAARDLNRSRQVLAKRFRTALAAAR